MADLWIDVDTAVTVPVNLLPLLDDTDFKTREVAVAYNAAGMDLVWNFVTCAGVMTQTAVTPTDGTGVYDWTHVGDGIYRIEIPASGGVSINNDTEGFGWFSGLVTGVLPWRGPVIGFRRAAMNDLLIEGSAASTNLEDFFDGTGYAGGTAKLQVDAVALSGDTTAADNAELMFDGTGYAGGTTKLRVDVDTVKTQAVTCAAGVTVLASVGTAATSTAQTGDNYALANGASGFVAIKGDTAAILADTGTDGVVIPQAQADKVWLTAMRVLTANTNFNDPTAAAVADAIWDEARAGHVAAGSFGEGVASVQGNVTGSVASVTGAVGSVTGAVGSVTGSVGSVTGAVGSVTGAVGSVTGAVGSVTAGVTVTTNNDKPGYALSAAAIQAIWDALSSALTTVGSIGKRLVDYVDVAISSRGTGTALDAAGVRAAVGLTAANLDTQLDALPTAGENADAVWDEDATAHQVQGTFGQAIGDPVLDANTIFGAVVTDATGATVGADTTTALTRIGTPSNLGGGATVAANLSDIEGQTDDIGAAGAGLTAVPWNAAWDAEVQSEVEDALDVTIADSVPADGTRPSVRQALYMVTQYLLERSVSGTTITVRKVDGSTALLTLTLNDATTPTSVTRAT